MTAGAFAFAAALFAWGPVASPPEPPAPETTEVAPPVPATPPAPPAPETPPPILRSTAAAPAAPQRISTPIIAKAPIDVRAQPTFVGERAPHKPMHKQWAFWAIVGGFAAATITLTILATRPQPEAYRGNAPPYYMPFP